MPFLTGMGRSLALYLMFSWDAATSRTGSGMKTQRGSGRTSMVTVPPI